MDKTAGVVFFVVAEHKFPERWRGAHLRKRIQQHALRLVHFYCLHFLKEDDVLTPAVPFR